MKTSIVIVAIVLFVLWVAQRLLKWGTLNEAYDAGLARVDDDVEYYSPEHLCAWRDGYHGEPLGTHWRQRVH